MIKIMLTLLPLFKYILLPVSIILNGFNTLHAHPMYLAQFCNFQENLIQFDEDPQDIQLISEIPFVGWCLQHPNDKLQVIFESYPDLSCMPNYELSPSYLLQFEGSRASGFLYIKWDQSAFPSKNTFKHHLEEMLLDITRLEPNEITADDYEYDLNQGYGILRGSPYGLISLSGDCFLYGFAVNAKSDPYDIHDLLHRIKWSIEYQ